MFDKKSDFALNKRNPDAIVYKSVTGEYIRLTRENFASEEGVTIQAVYACFAKVKNITVNKL